MRVLELYTHEGCFSHDRALEMLQKILPACPDISFNLVDIFKYPDKARALGIRMSPTLVMDGEIISVGMPEEKELRTMLQTNRQMRGSDRK